MEWYAFVIIIEVRSLYSSCTAFFSKAEILICDFGCFFTQSSFMLAQTSAIFSILLSYQPPFCVMIESDSSDIPMFTEGLSGADPVASRWAGRLRPSCEPQVKVAGNRCLSPPRQGEQRSGMGIGYTDRSLSEWNPYWLTRLIDSAAPATNWRLRLPPSVCDGDSGCRVTSWPPAYQV